MNRARPTNRPKQLVAWICTLLFVAGFFRPAIGNWTSPILATWFVSTQRPRRGFLWMLALAWIPAVLLHTAVLFHSGPLPALTTAAWMLLVAAFSVLPFTLHRLTSQLLPEFASMLMLPAAGVEFCALAQGTIPDPACAYFFPAPGHWYSTAVCLHLWLASAAMHAWNQEFRLRKLIRPLLLSALCVAAALGLDQISTQKLIPFFFVPDLLLWISVGTTTLLTLWAWQRPACPSKPWRDRSETLARLRSPYTGAPLRLVAEARGEALMSSEHERFPIRNGIADFVRPSEITGANRKYNHLYQTIGGFYDDTQRVGAALMGMDRDGYVRSYMNRLEVKPGDSVLETSVGTGLNFKYLPEGVRLTGLDLSAEMLSNCRTNLRRWRMNADLFLGNAEYLPFADNSFDVVFHVGGINFFSDRARAIREMIRVAKPGSLLLIADETEEHVQKAYENMPYTKEFFKDRSEVVSVPVDLLPSEMLDVHLEIVWGNRFYALTFRKPLASSDTEATLRMVART